MADTSFGEGLGLQSGGRDNFWAAKTAELGQYNRMKADKEKEDLVQMADVKVDYQRLLPAWGKRAGELTTEYLNQLAEFRQNDPRTARNKAQLLKYEYDRQIGELYAGNDRFKKDYATNDKIRQNPELLNAAFSTKSTLEDLAKFSDNDYIYLDSKGGFNYKPVPLYESDVKYLDSDFSERLTGNRRTIGNVGYNEIESFIKPESVQQKALNTSRNADFVANVRYDNTDVFKRMEGESDVDYKNRTGEFVFNEALKDAEQKKRMGTTRWDDAMLWKPNEPSEASKKVKPSIVPFDQKKFNESAGIKVVKNKETGKDEEVPTTIISQGASYSRMANMKPAKGVTIPVTDELIAINPELKGVDAISVTVNNLVEGYNPKGKKEWYGIGMQSDFAEPDEGSLAAQINEAKGVTTTPKKRTSYNPKIPLTYIKQALELAGNDLSEFEGQQVETKAPQQTTYKYKVSKGGKTIFSADGQTWFDEKGNTIK